MLLYQCCYQWASLSVKTTIFMGRIFFYFCSSCLVFYCLKNVTCFDRPDEAELFKKSAQNAYALFRDLSQVQNCSCFFKFVINSSATRSIRWRVLHKVGCGAAKMHSPEGWLIL
jgi:hypothetical protein